MHLVIIGVLPGRSRLRVAPLLSETSILRRGISAAFVLLALSTRNRAVAVGRHQELLAWGGEDQDCTGKGL